MMRALAVAGALAALAATCVDAADASGVDSPQTPQTGAEMLAEAGMEDIQVGHHRHLIIFQHDLSQAMCENIGQMRWCALGSRCSCGCSHSTIRCDNVCDNHIDQHAAPDSFCTVSHSLALAKSSVGAVVFVVDLEPSVSVIPTKAGGSAPS